MLRKLLANRVMIPILMIVQIVPLLIFPPSSYTVKSQEWWLPALLTFLVILSLVQLLIRRSRAAWPWYLLSFAQGFNIISRLMMLMPHATMIVEKAQRFNASYVLITLAAMIVSAFEIWYFDLPEVHNAILAPRRGASTA
jgi:hypothetical protein